MEQAGGTDVVSTYGFPMFAQIFQIFSSGTLQIRSPDHKMGYPVEFEPKFQPLQPAGASQYVSHILRNNPPHINPTAEFLTFFNFKPLLAIIDKKM